MRNGTAATSGIPHRLRYLLMVDGAHNEAGRVVKAADTNDIDINRLNPKRYTK